MGDTVIVETPIDEVVSIVTAGPQGPSGSEAATLTTTGDLLYRAALANDRLPIGSEGQVLKVASGLPAWGNESGSVTSVAGRTGDVTLAVADVTNAVSDSDARLTDSRTPTTHASTHATGGSDAIAPSDIGAQSIFESIAVTASADTTLTASRAARYNILNFTGTALNITLPTTNLLAGDVAIISSPVLIGSGSLVIRRLNADTSYTTLATITKSIGSNGETFRFYTVGAFSQDWRLDVVPNHGSTHASGGSDALALAASQITSGTLTHERGGLEADVSAYDGLVKISGGSTSAVTVTTAGEALLDDADAAAQRTTLGLGTVASSNSYTDLDNQPSIPSALNDLSNVSAATPSDNDVLVYDNATSTWVAEAPAAGGIAETLLDAKGDLIVASAADTAARLAVGANGTMLVADSGETTGVKWAAQPVEYVIACSDETSDLTTGTAKVTFRAPVAFLLTAVAASVNTAPTGSTLIVDINNGANSALSTKLSIDASEKTSATAATAAVIDTTYDDFAADSEITIDIDQTGSTIAGKGLKVVLKGTRA